MSGKRYGARAAGLILLIVGLAGACQDSDVLAPAESTMILIANPSQVVFPTDDLTPIPVHLSAQVRTSDGYPTQGVAVAFSTTSGDLDSRGKPVETDSSSVAYDVLTVYYNSPNSIDVTATSGALTKTIPITKVVGNPAPSDGTIAMSANPANVTLNSAVGPFSKDVTITAQVRDKSGYALAGIAVRFSTDTGTLDTETITGTTDLDGIVETTLTLTIDDPEGTVSVTAWSAPLSETLTIPFSIVTPVAATASRGGSAGLQRAGGAGAARSAVKPGL